MNKLIQELHRKTTSSFFISFFYTGLFFVFGFLTLLTFHGKIYWLTLILWLYQAYIGHAILLAFHEASHHVLHRNHMMNEMSGIFTGTVIFTPLSAYRWVHNQHHMHLGTESDTELWPYVKTGATRPLRLVVLFFELLLGCIYTPFVFIRGVLVAKALPKSVKRRLICEYSLVLAFWLLVVSLIAYFDGLVEFIIVYVVGTWGAGNLQSLRKLTEHLGMLGDDIPSKTRTIVATSPVHRIVSTTMFHIDMHGPHHMYGKIPCHNLPAATSVIYSNEKVFDNYGQAIVDMLKTILNPRIGCQWK